MSTSEETARLTRERDIRSAWAKANLPGPVQVALSNIATDMARIIEQREQWSQGNEPQYNARDFDGPLVALAEAMVALAKAGRP